MALLAVNVFLLAFSVQPIKAAGTIYIRADGSVNPPSAPISNVGNIYYTFTDDISDSIVVERDNIVFNGAGHVIEGTGTGAGIDLTGRSNVTLTNTTIREFYYGVYLNSSSGNTLYANIITNSSSGIYLYSSPSNSISANTITNSYHGIELDPSSGNSVSANTITNSYHGIDLYSSSGNSVFANTITTNFDGIRLVSSSGNSVSANNITTNEDYGIWLISSSSNSISANTITNTNEVGILLSASFSNSVSANTVTNNNYGIRLYSSSGNGVSANTITNNAHGIYFEYFTGNLIFHNNFVGNTIQAGATPGCLNVWDDGYPSGGNYWSDYAGVDLYKGAGQNVAGSDEIGDLPYTIDTDNKDNYPLTSPWTAITDVASLVVRGSNNIIYYRTYSVTTDSWTDWTALPGATCDSPAAALCNNELHIVVRAMDGNTLWHGYVSLMNQVFSGWTLLSGSTPSAPTLTGNSTHLCLVVRGQNNLIYHRFYDCASHTWTDWAALPSGSTCDGPAAIVLANKLHVVVRGMDGYSIWHSNVDLSTGAFSGWQLVGGATESKPTLAACDSRNEIILVVRGLNDVIHRNSWTGSSWTGWSGLPTGATCDGIGATVIGKTLNVVVRGMDGYSLWHSSVDLAASDFSDWTLLSGSTPSTPTLAR